MDKHFWIKSVEFFMIIVLILILQLTFLLSFVIPILDIIVEYADDVISNDTAFICILLTVIIFVLISIYTLLYLKMIFLDFKWDK